jgi:ribonuclease HI
LKCPDWKLWAYTDGSCIGKAENFIGAGVYCPQTKAECYVDSGGVVMTNTINRAELTGIAAALTNKYTQIATYSACSLSQIRKQLLFPEMQWDHIHSNLLEQIVSMIYASPEPICFYKVKAHSGIAGNECADAVAKHSALHDMTCTFSLQLRTVMHTHTFTGLRLKTLMRIPPSGRGTITPRLCALSDLKAELITEMCKSHRLGRAKTNTSVLIV